MHLGEGEAKKSLRINARTAKMAKSEANPNPTEPKSQRRNPSGIRGQLSDKPN